MFEHLVLGLLLNEPLTGYTIKRKIEFCFGSFCKASFGSLYPALKRLTANGFVELTESKDGERKKNYYSITDEGKRHFMQWLTEPSEVIDGENQMLAHIFFFDILDDEQTSELLLQYKTNNVKYLAKLIKLSEQLDNCSEIYFRMSTLYYGITATQKTIKWCSHLLEKKPLNKLIKEEKL